MREYVIGLFAVALCCAAVELFSPEGEGGGIARHIKLMTGLCLLCVLVSPVLTLLRQGGDIPLLIENALSEWLETKEQAEADFSDRWQEQYEQMDIALANETIKSMIVQEFSMAAEDISVDVSVNSDKTAIEHIRIALSGRAIWLNTHELEAFLDEMFGCACTIYIE